jgi:glyoxylase-like metal-dependent hydrolase (beta-lactamase superfamily II)
MLREVLAPNASPMTFDGTRTFLIGERRVAILDPGSADGSHLDAVARAVGDGVCVAVLVTHGHPDHEAGAADLAGRLGAPVRRLSDGTLGDGDRVETDAGDLLALETPGHTPDHLAFHWPSADAVFCGDLMMGGADTALVAFPEGDLSAYLRSLERLRRLGPRVIHPAHGADITRPGATISRYIEHRAQRETQVLNAIADGAEDADALVLAVYGATLPAGFHTIARAAALAYVEHLTKQGRLGADVFNGAAVRS